MKTVWLLRASGGEYDDAWEAVIGVYASEEDAMAAQIRYEQKELGAFNENLVRRCAHCNWTEEFHPGGALYRPDNMNKCLNFVARKSLAKLPDNHVSVWYLEEEVGKDGF